MSTLAGFTEPIPHIPYFCRNGNYIVKEWVEDFTDAVGNSGQRTMIIFYDKKKNKNSEPVIRYVKWK